MKRIGLVARLLIAIAVGIIIGALCRQAAQAGANLGAAMFPVKLLGTFNTVFGSFLGAMVPLLVLAFVTVGIGELGKGAGKTLLVTVGLAYFSTVFFASGALFVDSFVFKALLQPGSLSIVDNPENAMPGGYFPFSIPPVMDIMTALIIAFVVGLGLTGLDKNSALRHAAQDFQKIIEGVISKAIIPFLPLHVMGIFSRMTYADQIWPIMKTMGIVFVTIIILHFVTLTIQYTIAGAINGVNPFRLLKNMMPAYLTAVGTQSSVASIPVNLAQTKKNGVNEEIADFVIPLSATIHLCGSAITVTSCAYALSIIYDLQISPGTMVYFIAMLGITVVAAPGVPGGVGVASLGILKGILGFDENLLSLMVALYLAQDSFGTACNVTGSGALACIINKISGKKLNIDAKSADAAGY